MFASVKHLLRLARAGRVIARYDGLLLPEQLADMPAPARLGLKLAKLFAGRSKSPATGSPLAAALTELGPTYIKLGQFLATRPDIVGSSRAVELSELQDKLPAFSQQKALAEIASGLGQPADALFPDFGPAVAAASIAQVHKATVHDPGEEPRQVAVKILRPGIEARFNSDLESFFFAARAMERWHAPSRRLRPVDAVATLARSVSLEMDLRMEAAAISEMASNTEQDPGFRVPAVDWQRTAKRILTTEWVDGIPLTDLDRLTDSGVDLAALGEVPGLPMVFPVHPRTRARMDAQEVAVPSHVQLVERLGLDGVHLTDAARSVLKMRKELGDDAIIGAYCGQSSHDGMTAGELGADYVAFGPVGASALGDGETAPKDLFQWWSQMIEVPVVAEGALTDQLIADFAPFTDFFGIGDEIWTSDNAKSRLLDFVAAMS